MLLFAPLGIFVVFGFVLVDPADIFEVILEVVLEGVLEIVLEFVLAPDEVFLGTVLFVFVAVAVALLVAVWIVGIPLTLTTRFPATYINMVCTVLSVLV